MPTCVQFRRGTTAVVTAFIGADGEIAIDSTKHTIRVYDGSTAGGFEIPTSTSTNTLTNKSLSDSTTYFIDETDTTKKFQFQASGITTATTRTLTIPDASGTIALTSNKLSTFAATTSAELAGVISDETGSGALVFATSPTLVTPILGTPTSGTLTNCTRLPVSTGVSGLGAGVATFLGTPSSANLASAMTDETGSGALVFATSPTLVTPVLGVASATSINKLSITAPATGSTLAIAEGKTLTASNTLTFTGTDGSSVNVGAGGTMATTSSKLSAFASTTSAELATVISDETGSGALVFASGPTLAGTVTHTGTLTSSGATFSGSWAGSPTFTGHVTLEGVTPTGATGTGKFAFDTTPTFQGGNNAGITVNSTTTNQPAVSLTNATTGALARILATNAKGLEFDINGTTAGLTISSAGAVVVPGTLAVTGHAPHLKHRNDVGFRDGLLRHRHRLPVDPSPDRRHLGRTQLLPARRRKARRAVGRGHPGAPPPTRRPALRHASRQRPAPTRPAGWQPRPGSLHGCLAVRGR